MTDGVSRSPFTPREPLGWPLLPVPDQNGTLHWPGLDSSVRQTIRAILMTRKGEWLLHRKDGVGLGDYLHLPNSAVTRRRLRDAIVSAITRMETRITLDAVDVKVAGDHDDAIVIRIVYRINRTKQPGAVSVTLKTRGA